MHFTSKKKTFQAPSSHLYSLRLLNHERVLEFNNDACVRCGLCLHACPIGEDVITMPGKQDEKIDIDLDRCVHCGCCDYFCPAGALTLSINGEPRIELREPAGEIERSSLPDLRPVPLARVDGREPPVNNYLSGALHVPWLDAAGSRAAVESCPTGALTMQGDRIRFDQEKCFFCDACSLATGGEIRVSRNMLLADLSDGISPLVKRFMERLMGPETAARVLKGSSGGKARTQTLTLIEQLGK